MKKIGLVELSHSGPWLFVVYTTKDLLDKNVRSHDFLSSYCQVVSLAKRSDTHFECIMLASPGCVNLSDSWRFDEINEIWKGDEPEPDCEKTGVVYVLKDGSRLVHSLHNNEKMLSNLRRVYPV